MTRVPTGSCWWPQYRWKLMAAALHCSLLEARELTMACISPNQFVFIFKMFGLVTPKHIVWNTLCSSTVCARHSDSRKSRSVNEFSSVSGSCYCSWWLTVTLSWLTHLNRTETFQKLSITSVLFFLYGFTREASRMRTNWSVFMS